MEIYELLDRDKPTDKKIRICIKIAKKKSLRKREIAYRPKKEEGNKKKKKGIEENIYGIE